MRIFLLALALAAPAVGAQTMYRCGNTFSQQPCSPDATATRAPGMHQASGSGSGGGDESKVEAMRQQCRDWLTRVPPWLDRDSLRIGPIVRGKAEMRTVSGIARVVRAYGTSVNAKNQYGAYAGDRPATCYANESETQIVDGQVITGS